MTPPILFRSKGQENNQSLFSGKIFSLVGTVELEEMNDAGAYAILGLGHEDRFLRFTLTNLSLHQSPTYPPDAFSAALLSAATGLPVTAPITLPDTDAFLNLQPDGTEYLSPDLLRADNPDGSRTYTLDLRSIPPATTVTLSFALLGFGPADSHVTISDIRLVNLPETQSDTVTTAEDTPTLIDALQNDTDVGLDRGFFPEITAAPAHGTTTINPDGTFSYTPSPDFFGDDAFTYKLTDGTSSSNLATVSITITPVADAPIAQPDTASTNEDASQITLDIATLLANDTDADPSDTKTITAVTSSAAGAQVSLALDHILYDFGNLFQNLPEGSTATDSFTYTITDNAGLTSTTAVTVQITGINDAPTPTNDTTSLAEDSALVATGNVLTNDTDPDAGTTLTVATPGTYAGQFGSLTLSANGDYTYTLANDSPAVQSLREGEIVTDVFSYAATDALQSTAAQLVLVITGINDAPVPTDDDDAAQEDGSLVATGNALTNDTDVDAATTLTIAAPGTYAGQYGSLTLAPDGSYTYTLANDAQVVQSLRAGEMVTDTFTYAATDGSTSSPAQIRISITGQNDAPIAMGDVTGVQDEGIPGATVAVSGDVLANDTDVDTVTVLTVAAPGSYVGQYGTLTIAPGGGYSYALATNTHIVRALRAGETVSETFAYAASDGITSTPATLRISITGHNDAPMAANDVAAIQDDGVLQEEADIIGNVLTNDSDVDTDAVLTVTTPGSYTSQYGTLTLADDGSYTYALAHGAPIVKALRAGQTVTDLFAYTASDGITSTPAQIRISITGRNDAPVITDDVTILQDDGVLREEPDIVGNALANDSDADAGDILTVTAPGTYAGQYGTLELAADGSYSYSLAHGAPIVMALREGQTVTEVFAYEASDGVASTPGTIRIMIKGRNDAPSAQPDNATAVEDGPGVTLTGATLLANDTDADAGDTKTITAVTGSAAGAVVGLFNGNVIYYVGKLFQSLGAGATTTDTFTYTMKDSRGAASSATVTMTVSGVNDAPIVASSTVSGAENTPYLFTWGDFHATDVDSATLTLTISALPLDGQLQRFAAGWSPVTVGQTFPRSEIDAGHLRFVPDVNESGSPAFTTAGVGNRKQHYAQFTYKVSDGALTSATAVLTVDIAPLANTPILTLGSPADATNFGATKEHFRTSFENNTNATVGATLVSATAMEGWSLVTGPAGNGLSQVFEIWSSGDKLPTGLGTLQVVYAAAGNGNGWLNLNEGTGSGHQTLGIERSVATKVSATYALSFDYAGHIGASGDLIRVGILVDGVKIASLENASPTTGLNWKPQQLTFSGNGASRSIKLVTEAKSVIAAARGAMIDDIALVEQLPLNTGYANGPIRLSTISASVSDIDGSEALALAIQNLPVGSALTDGLNTFTATAGQTTATITSWALDKLSMTPPTNYTGSFALPVVATATETATGETRSATANLTVTVK